MEIVGGFMVMMSILGFFLAAIWLIMPFVVLAIKGKQDRAQETLESIEQRLGALEGELRRLRNESPAPPPPATAPLPDGESPAPPVLPLA